MNVILHGNPALHLKKICNLIKPAWFRAMPELSPAHFQCCWRDIKTLKIVTLQRYPAYHRWNWTVLFQLRAVRKKKEAVSELFAAGNVKFDQSKTKQDCQKPKCILYYPHRQTDMNLGIKETETKQLINNVQIWSELNCLIFYNRQKFQNNIIINLKMLLSWQIIRGNAFLVIFIPNI